MISLSGPRTGETGTVICITATNVGGGFSASGTSSGSPVALKISIDSVKHTATICFTAPASKGSVSIDVSSNSSNDTTGFTVFIR